MLTNPITVGEVRSSFEILEAGVLGQHGFENIGIAGHPEGSPDITQETINEFLLKKFELSQYLEAHPVLFGKFFPFIKSAFDSYHWGLSHH